MFGLHPALRPLLPMWKAGKLGAVHATGMRMPNRSHFAAMEAVEDADPGSAARLGWLNRLVGELPGLARSAGLSVGSPAHADVALRPRARHGGHGPQPGSGGRRRAE